MSAEANKAIKDMTHEEVLEALPRLRAEAATANARVHEAMERVSQTDEVPTHVEVHGDHLVISVRGKELSLTFLSDLRIPLEHVQRVTPNEAVGFYLLLSGGDIVDVAADGDAAVAARLGIPSVRLNSGRWNTIASRTAPAASARRTLRRISWRSFFPSVARKPSSSCSQPWRASSPITPRPVKIRSSA